jgi:type I restriction enzyme S subunit
MIKLNSLTLDDISAPGRSVISGPFGSSIGKRFFKSEGIPVIRGNNLTTDFKKFKDIGFVFLTEKKADELKADAVKGDVLFTAAGTIGQVGMIPKSSKYDRYVISNKQIRFRVDTKKADPDFVYYWLASPWIKKTIENRNTGSTVPLINLGIIKSLPISLPESIQDQQKISRIFSLIDEKIELNNRINKELEAMAKLIYDYWFVQFDFPDVNGKPYKSSGGKMIYSEELKLEIPYGWDVYSLSSIFRTNYSSIGKSDCYETIEYLDTGSLTKNVIKGTELICTANDKVPSRAKRIVHKNDILYSTVRPNLCHYGIVKDPVENMIASTGFAQLSSKIDWVSNDFMYTFLTSNWVTDRLHQIAALAVSAYPSISPTDILNLNIALPKNSSLIKNANKQFCELYSKISVSHEENKQLSELRDWLLPMLMSGQVTVK